MHYVMHTANMFVQLGNPMWETTRKKFAHYLLIAKMEDNTHGVTTTTLVRHNIAPWYLNSTNAWLHVAPLIMFPYSSSSRSMLVCGMYVL